MGDGARDHMCAIFGNAHDRHTPCAHIMTGSWRYLAWPKLQTCCKCGAYINGYGPMSPMWVQNKTGNLAYEGVSKVHLSPSVSYLCNKWVVYGLGGDNNYYYQHVSSDTSDVGPPPCEVDGFNWLHTPSQ